MDKFRSKNIFILKKAIFSREKLFIPGLALLALGLWFPQLLHLAQLRPPNSDDATIILTGADLASGNWLLRGWNLPPDSFITSDVPFYALGNVLLGLKPGLMQIVPTVIFCGVIFLSILLSGSGLVTSRLRNSVIAFLLLATPSYTLASLALEGPIHMGTVLFCLASFIATTQIFTNRGAGKLAGAGLTFVLLTLGIVGDPLALVIGAIPVGLAALAVLGLYRFKEGWYVLAAAGLAVLLSRFSPVKTIPVTPVITFDQLDQNVGLLAESFLYVLLPNIFLLIAGLLALGWTFKKLWGERKTFTLAGLVDCLLLAGIAANIAAFLFTSAPTDLATARYLLPTVVFGFILLAKRLGDLFEVRHWLFWLACLVLIVPTMWSFMELANTPAEPAPQTALVAWLDQQRLTEGYADYWDANILTVQSENKIRVRPVRREGLKYAPYRWNTRDDWYQPFPPATTLQPFFMLYQTDPPPFRTTDPGQGNAGITAKITAKLLDRLALLLTFGPPTRIASFDTYQILVWERGTPQSSAWARP
ncbi:MAG: hypothetical protein J0I20_29775 [Chloroflexi bacterium]|nr:hypothetical protein [Chloroflexota bacterium]OJV95931.1 MAG: hypothetical protein BGO39_03605 [Chloroflexi bacterium 54-19]